MEENVRNFFIDLAIEACQEQYKSNVKSLYDVLLTNFISTKDPAMQKQAEERFMAGLDIVITAHLAIADRLKTMKN